jgi:dimeric dUTPase (all-alpha-NTP-PPase superfamily)
MEFWNFLIKMAQYGNICSIDKAYDELKNGRDGLSKWVTNHFYKYFKKTDTESVLKEYIDLVKFVQSQAQYNDMAKEEFMSGSNADAWIIAYAKANKLSIVTLEVLNKQIKRKVPIPNICEAFQIKYFNIFDFLKKEGFKFCEGDAIKH